MPSPFPGMDPSIEQPSLWGDFHDSLATEIRNQLNQAIRPRYFARLIPYVTYESLGIGEVSRTYPHVSVFQTPQLRETIPGPVMVTTPVPVLEPAPVESEVAQEFPFDYTKDPPPPKLAAEEAAWMQQLLQTRSVS